MNLPIVRMPAMSTPTFTADGQMSDGLINFVSRMGTGTDKASHGHYMRSFLAMFDLEAAYSTSWFRKICDIPPFDEVREGRTWVGADDDQITLIDKEEKRLNLMEKIKEARILARKDGGAALVIGTGGNATLKLDPTSIKQGGLKFVNVVSRLDIQPGVKDTDPYSETFGQPERYFLRNAAGTEIHPSRVIRFIGNPIRMQGHWDGWGESLWVELRDAVKHADQIAAGVASLVEEAKVDIIRIKGLMGGLATSEYEELLMKRWAAMGTFKSTQNALLLDFDDEFEQKVLTFGGLTDIQASALMIMSGMADIPATRLLGRSPQGMNATGDSDMRNYYDRIRAGQKLTIGPAIAQLDECMVRSAIGDKPNEIYYEWNPLYTMTETEAADVEKKFADSAKVYSDAGLIPKTALGTIVRDGIIERGQWPGAQKAFDTADAEGELAPLLEEPTEAEQAAEQAKTAVALATAANPTGMASQRPKLVAANDMRFSDATPRTLYVRRDVVNKADISKWARAQGFTAILDDLHVTIIHSDTPLDWMQAGSSWNSKLEIPAGGPRIVDRLGTFAVLLFTADDLVWRHDAILRAGAESNFPEYQPHISIQKDPDALIDVTKIKPYTGKIVLGPEIFEETKLD